MRTLSPDTTPEAEEVWLETLRRMPAWRGVQLADRLGATVRSAMRGRLLAENPGLSEDDVLRLTAQQWLGPKLAAAWWKARVNRAGGHGG